MTAGEARAAGRPPASCAPLPHADPLLFAQGPPNDHFINWQQDPQGNYLARLVFPEPDRRVPGRSRARRRDGGHQSVRLLPRARRRRNFLSPTTNSLARNSAPIWKPNRAGPKLLAASLDRCPRVRTRPSISSSTSTARPADIGYVIRMEPGIQTCEETLTLQHRFLPGLAHGCSSRSCAISASPPASFPAI